MKMAWGTVQCYTGDARIVLAGWPAACVQCVVTSPPYWGLRKYAGAQEVGWADGGHGALGLEPTPDAYVAHLVEVFREVRRVLRDDGTLWLNLGDSYARNGGTDKAPPRTATCGNTRRTVEMRGDRTQVVPPALKEKDLVGIPWRVAFALQADGWYLRSDIIWSKPNPMPESVTDRPTRAHEYVFLLTKSARYYYDADAIREPYAASTLQEFAQGYAGTATKPFADAGAQDASAVKRRIVEKHRSVRPGIDTRGGNQGTGGIPVVALGGANARSVWRITPTPYRDAHFATFPPALVDRCLQAGSRVGDWVLDPFAGSGTVGAVASVRHRHAALIDTATAYTAMQHARVADAHARPERYRTGTA